MSVISTLWILVAAALVFFMQAGFAMLEVGFTRAKNAGNIIMKNLIDFTIGVLVFGIVGFGLMYGSKGTFAGTLDLFVQGDYSGKLPEEIPFFAFLLFQTMFCATAATIASGAMAERTRFLAYCIFSAGISAIIYPIAGHWIWGGGWLEQMGFHDLAGGTAVHLVGGVNALIGAWMLGPRYGKYSKEGKSRAISGHNLPLAALGIFILWFGWFGFNGGSTLSFSEETAAFAGKILYNMNLSAASAVCMALVWTWIRFGKPDLSMNLNAALAGLVAITAGSDAVSPVGAVIIGALAGILIIVSVEWIDKRLKIDDPVGAVSAHGVCGAYGTVMVGLFSTEKGLIYTGKEGLGFFGVQVLGVLAVAVWTAVMAFLILTVIKKTVGIRVDVKAEIAGLDRSEHGLISTYGGMSFVTDTLDIGETEAGTVSIEEAIPVSTRPFVEGKMTKVEILTRQAKFEILKEEMNKIGVTGMTVTQVLGCGMQKGATEYYRGVPVDVQLLPKIQVEIVVAKVPVQQVIDTARKVLYTGHIGDGKIFIYDVENVVKVRTGEEGYNALQGVDD